MFYTECFGEVSITERKMTSNKIEDELRKKVREFTPEELQEAYKNALAAIARQNDNPKGFAAAYKLFFGNDIPPYAMEWVETIYNAKKEDRGSLIFAFRGSWKTTTLTEAFTAFRIGHEPTKSNLIIQDTDKNVKLTIKAIADIIDSNEGFKRIFCRWSGSEWIGVVPDKDHGWGAEGYEVKRNDIGYDEWRNMNATRKDPTLRGAGYDSSIIGGHPDGVLFIDDIHNEKNSVSVLERNNVINILTKTILPMSVQDETKAKGERLITWLVAVGTPWDEEDAYHYLKNTGQFDFIETPGMKAVEEDDPDAFYIGAEDMKIVYQDIIGWWKTPWPEHFSKRIVIGWRALYNKRGFWQMVMMDLNVAKETGLKYQTYPSNDIDIRWPASGGVDYASVEEMRGKDIDLKDRSMFALCAGFKLPTLGAVVADGVAGFFSQLQGENYIESFQNKYPLWSNCGVEMNGKGEEFYYHMMNKPLVRLMPQWTGAVKKTRRHEAILSPLLEDGTLKISDAQTDFMLFVRKSLDDFPNGNLDVLDAMVSFVKTIPEAFVKPIDEDRLEREVTYRAVGKPANNGAKDFARAISRRR